MKLQFTRLSTQFCLAAAVLVQGCAMKEGLLEGSQESVANTIQSAVAEAGSHASATEGGSLALALGSGENWASADYVNPLDSLQPTALSCTYSSARSACSANQATVNWDNCEIAGGQIKFSGQWREVYSGTGSASCTVPVSQGGSVTRTSFGVTAQFPAGIRLITDTQGGVAYDGTVLSGQGVTVANDGTYRTITLRGVHRVMNSSNGQSWFEHYLETGSPLLVSGSRVDGNRTVTSGSIKVYHELGKYTAVNTFHDVVWGEATCCYPTSGRVTSSFSGSINGTATLEFEPGSSCGSAKFTDSQGQISDVSLTHCE